MTAGHWHVNHFPVNHWIDDHWQDYGLVVPPVQLFCNLYRLWILTGRI